MATVISAKFTLTGTKESERELERVAVELDKIFAKLNTIAKAPGFVEASKNAKIFIRDLRAINKEFKEIEKRKVPLISRPTSGSGSRPSATPPAARPQQYDAVLKKVDTLVKKQREWNKEIGGTGTAIKVLNRELKEGVGRADDDYKQLITETARLKSETKAVTDEVRKQQRAFAAAKTGQDSYRQLNERLVQLRNQFKSLSAAERKSAIGKDILQNIQALDRQLKKVDASMGQYQRNVGNYQSALRGFRSTLVGIAAITGINVSGRELIETNAELSDSLAFVRRTTALTKEEIDDLYDSLRARIDAGETRSSLEDQLGIAKIGGRLGVAKDELLGFLEVIDNASTALGDELGGGVEGIATDLQKLNQVLGVETDKGTAAGLNSIGSAINELGKAGPASAEFLVGFAKRVGGIAPSAKVAASDVFALGAVLDELGQTQEVAGTAITKILIAIGQDVPRFADIAGTSVAELSEQLATNGTDALLSILKGAGAVDGGLEQLSATLEAFGISGARVAPVLGVLVNNTDLLEEKIALSNQAFEEGISLSDEFALANQTLGAAWERLGNTALNAITQIGFQEFLADGVNAIAKFIVALRAVPEFIEEYKAELIVLGLALVALNAKTIATAAANLYLATTEKIASLATKELTLSQTILNAVMSVNPVSILIIAFAALITIMIKLYKNIDIVIARFNEWKESAIAATKSIPILGRVVKFVLDGISQALENLKNLPAIFKAVVAAVKAGANSIGNAFQSLRLGAEQLGAEIRRALTPGETPELDAYIDSIQRARDELKENSKSAVDVFKQTLAIETAALAAERRLKKLKSEASAAENISVDGTGPGPEPPPDDLSKLDEQQKKRIQLFRKFVDERRSMIVALNLQEEEQLDKALAKESKKRAKAREERIEKEADAARKIRDFEIALIEDDQVRETQQAQTTATEKKRTFEGTDEQRTEFESLVDVELERTLKTIEEKFTQKRIDAVKTFEELIGTQLAESYSNMSAKELEAERDRTEAALAQIEANNETRINQINQTFAERSVIIENLFLAGDIDTSEREAQLQELEDKRRDDLLENERKLAEERAELISTIALDNIALQRAIADAELAIITEKNERILENEKKTADQRKKLADLQVGALKSFVSSAQELLGQDEANRKKYSAVLKALALAEIGINLSREITAINANPVVNADLTQATRTLLIAAAIARSTVQAIKVVKTEFAYGGSLPADELETVIPRKSSPKLTQTKPSTHHTGINTKPRRSSAGLPLSDVSVSPQGHLWNVRPLQSLLPGSNIPDEGIITGRAHGDQGIKAIDRHGNLIEVEGGEYLLKNGNEVYILNKKSTRIHRTELDRIKSRKSRRYDPAVRQRAMQINTFRSYGVKFQTGGELTSAATTALSQPVITPLNAPSTQILAAQSTTQLNDLMTIVATQSGQIRAVQESLEDSFSAINGRIDRIVVTTDPADLLDQAIEQKSISL